jgi:ankyrin repeat protein
VSECLRRGAFINRIHKHTGTALMGATLFGHTQIVRYLLERGANPSVRVVETGETALQRARQRSFAEIERLLLEAGASE